MRMLCTAAVGVALLAVGSGIAVGQRSGGGGTNSGNVPLQNPQPTIPGRGPVGFPSIDGREGETDSLGPRLAEQQAKTRNTERQKKLVADTDKLLALVMDLKQQMERSNKDGLPADVVKKTEEIEKLAKSVKDRMKG